MSLCSENFSLNRTISSLVMSFQLDQVVARRVRSRSIFC